MNVPSKWDLFETSKFIAIWMNEWKPDLLSKPHTQLYNFLLVSYIKISCLEKGMQETSIAILSKEKRWPSLWL